MINFDDFEKKDAIGRNNLKIGEFIVVDSNCSKGFNFRYVVFIPNEIDNNTTLIVEGANTGRSSENIDIANQCVLEESTRVQLPIYYIASNMKMPILIPLFPRVRLDDKTYYTHMLTSDILRTEDKLFKRLDNQLIAMVEDAKERFKKSDINIKDKFVIDGFSASGKFANRFTILHPDKVCLCIAGGVAGCLTLPLKEINKEKLLYPIGVGDIDEFTNEQFEKFIKVKQFYYMGLEDNNDPFSLSDDDSNKAKYNDVMRIEEIKQLHKILGADVIKTRWKNTQEYYNSIGINVEFASYEGYGHMPHPATDRIIELLQEIKNDQTKTR